MIHPLLSIAYFILGILLGGFVIALATANKNDSSFKVFSNIFQAVLLFAPGFIVGTIIRVYFMH